MADLNDPKTYWWRNAVIYQVYVRSFADSDGDGIGDLPGITSRLPHLADLGVDALWITPFYTSPQHDHGYDVADYRDVDPLFGSLADADDLIARAHELGLRVIVDLVPNHTSDQHEWFQAALAAGPGSPERAPLPLPRRPEADGGRHAAQQLGVGLRRPGVDAGRRRPVVPPPLRLHASPTSTGATPRCRRCSRTSCASGSTAASTASASTSRTACSRRPACATRWSPRAAGPAPARSTPTTRWSRATSRTSRCGTSRRSTTSTARWHRVLDEAGPDRMAVAEAWTQTPESMAAFVRPDELDQAFNFAWLLADWSAEAFATVITDTLAAVEPVGASPTWVLSNHDVVRHVTRYGGGEQGLARGRAATLAMLALPGSSYLYQGEELGLEQVDVAPEDRQDPSYLRTGEVGRDGCRVPIPWGGNEAPYGFGPGDGQPWIPQPADWASLTVDAQTGAEGSTLEFYRAALAARREFAWTAGEEVELLDLGTDVLAFRRGPVTVVLNCGDGRRRAPRGRAAAGQRPGRRRQAARRHRGLAALNADA